MSTKVTDNSMRLDKWLWCARFYKTRSQASDAIKSGKVKCNGAKIKPAQHIREGQTLEIRKPPYSWQITISSLAKSRGSAQIAALLFEESAESKNKREELQHQLKLLNSESGKHRGKPEKRERQKIIRFTRDPGLQK